MAVAGERQPSLQRRSVNEHSLALAHEWRRLGRLATAVAVLTILPPDPDRDEAEPTAGQLPPFPAMFFRPGDLRGELGVPLETTLPAAPPRPEQIDLEAADAKRIDALTRGNFFTASFQQGQDASVFLVLDR